MHNSLFVSILLFSFASAVPFVTVQERDLEVFKGLVHSGRKFATICDLYYTLQLANELSVSKPSLDCKDIPFSSNSVEESYYSYAIAKEYKCQVESPADLVSVISSAASAEAVLYAIDFPKLKYDVNDLAKKMYERLTSCMADGCPEMTFVEKSAMVTILYKISPSLAASTKSAIREYSAIGHSLLQSILVNQKVMAVEEGDFFALADLVFSLSGKKLITEQEADSLAIYFLQFHSTRHSCYAATLLRVLTTLEKMVSKHLLTAYVEATPSEVLCRVVGITNQPIRGLVVTMLLNEEEKMTTDSSKGYVASSSLKKGEIQGVTVRISTKEGSLLLEEVVPVLISNVFVLTGFTLTIDKTKESYTIPGVVPDLEMSSKSNVLIDIAVKQAAFMPDTIVLVMKDIQSQKQFALSGLVENSHILVSFSPYQKEIGAFFAYSSSQYVFTICIGDKTLAAPIVYTLLHMTIAYDSVPTDPVYPLYSKPLLYASENSAQPLKEISHQFRPETKNPFFVFPFSFCVALIACIGGLLLAWNKVGFRFQKESMKGRLMKGIFWVCIVGIILLYGYFWYGWNMGSLLQVLIPLVLVTVVVGNRAL